MLATLSWSQFINVCSMVFLSHSILYKYCDLLDRVISRHNSTCQKYHNGVSHWTLDNSLHDDKVPHTYPYFVNTCEHCLYCHISQTAIKVGWSLVQRRDDSAVVGLRSDQLTLLSRLVRVFNFSCADTNRTTSNINILFYLQHFFNTDMVWW